MKENFGDRHNVKQGESFVKVWTFKNTGETDWPADSLFIQTNGDNLEAHPYPVVGPIKAGQEFEVIMQLQAP